MRSVAADPLSLIAQLKAIGVLGGAIDKFSCRLQAVASAGKVPP
jgi:hypothetical protein